ncbi:MAG: hypothetical protein WBA97_16765 [Actinophytocola sp.]|uniref:hypothetical protein n=1 Tax=Actinophytocola sp. TaxID=1872138 RepID=UPI003C74EA02
MGNKLVGRLGAALMIVAGVAVFAPVAAAEEANWTAVALEVPADVFSVRVNGTDGVDKIVGSYDGFGEGGQIRPGVVWHGTALTVLGEAFDDLTDLTAINGGGVAVGSHASIDEQSQAVKWTGGHYEDLPAPAGSASVATSVNERGDIVGTADGQVILWPVSAPGTYRLLPMPYPTFATGVSIGNGGTVAAGVLEPVGSGPNRAFRWDSAGQPHELRRVEQNYGHSVLTIENGTIAGSANLLGAVIWKAGGKIQRFLPGIQLYGMNANGDLLARGDEGGSWFVEENGVRTDLPTTFLPSYPTTLFTNGTVAGYSYDETTFEQTAVVWQRT